MPRPLRIDFPGAKHHVMNRGIRRQPVFLDDWCCEEFLCSLGDVVSRYGVVLHGYALMPNHFHLLIESTHGNLSPAMAHLSSTFSARMNKRQGWEGAVFRGRFHNRVVSDDAHWLYLLAYLHLNPVKARLAMTLEQTRWTSHAIYAGMLSCPEWLHTKEMLLALGGDGGYTKFINSIQKGRRPTPEGFESVLFGGRRSSEAFVTKKEEAPRNISAQEALHQVLKITGASKAELTKTKRGTVGNPARAIAAWFLTREAGLTNVKAGEILRMTPVAISKTLARVQNQLAINGTGKIAQWILIIGEELKRQ